MGTDNLHCGLPRGSPDGQPSPTSPAAGPLFYIYRSAFDDRIVALYQKDRRANGRAADKAESPAPVEPVERLEAQLCRGVNPRARMEAAWKLGRIQDPEAMQSLVRALIEGDECARMCAARALVRVGSAAIRPLLDALRHGELEVRRKVIWVLWSIGDRRAVRPLIASLRDEDYKVRAYAAWALGRLADARAIPALINALDDEHKKVHWDAAIALAKLGAVAIKPLTAALRDPRPQVRVGAANALGWLMEPDAIQALVEALHDPDAEVRARAAFALGWIKDPLAVDALTDALADKDEQVRMQAAVALGWIRAGQVAEPLARLTADAVEWVRYAAVEALADIGGAEAVRSLRQTALHSPHARVREIAGRALRRLASTQADEPPPD